MKDVSRHLICIDPTLLESVIERTDKAAQLQ